MSMVIACESCESRFRFNEELLKGAKGALVKCPRCGERILVRNPAAPRPMPPVSPGSIPRDTTPIVHRVSPPLEPPVAPPAAPTKPPLPGPPTAVVTNNSPVQVEGQGGMISPVPPKRHDAGDELAAIIGSGAVLPEIPGKYAQRVEDLFRSPSEAEIDLILSGKVDPSMEDLEAGPAWSVPPPRPLHQRPLFIAAVISVLLLLGGGAFYYVDGNPGRKALDRLFPVKAQNAYGHPVFDLQNLKGDLSKQATGERLFVIKGTVTNVGNSLSRGIRIQATLLGMDNQAVMQNETFAGNLIDESLMPHMPRVRIEGYLGMRYGEGDTNRDIPVGVSLPFMVVFFDPPEGIQSFTVKAMDVGEAEKIQPPGAGKTDARVSTQQSIRVN